MTKYRSMSPALRAALTAVIWWMLVNAAEGASHAVLGHNQGRTTPPAGLGRCEPAMLKGLFPVRSPVKAEPQPELRVLITRLMGSDHRSQEFGAQVAKSLRTVLNSYARLQLNAVQSELPASAVRTELVLCELWDHEHALAIGAASGADVVLWGQAFCEGCTSRQAQQVQISIHADGANTNNTLSQSPNAVMTNDVHIVKPQISVEPQRRRTEGTFTTSLTLVHWQGLDAEKGGVAEFRRLDKVASLSLPLSSSPRPELLLNVALGIYASRARQHRLAIELFKRASKDIPNGVGGVHRLHRMLGMSYLMSGQSRDGIEELRRASRACPEHEPECQQIAETELGLAQLRFGFSNYALDRLKDSLELALKRDDRLSEAAALNNIGLFYADAGDLAYALRHFERALALRGQTGDVAGAAATLRNLGLVYSAQRDLVTALSFFERALTLSQSAGDVLVEATTLNHLGWIDFTLGKHAKALGYFERALLLSQKIEDVSSAANVLNNIGLVYKSLKEKDKALIYHQRALILIQQVGELRMEGITRDHIGSVLYEIGRLPEAVRSFQAAADCYVRANHLEAQEHRSLDRALSIALFGQLAFDALAILKSPCLIRGDGIHGALQRARLAGVVEFTEVAAYQALETVADSASEEDRRVLLILARAGQTRATNRASWPSCDGSVITKVEPESSAAMLGLQVGDVLLRYDGQCLKDDVESRTPIGATTLGKPAVIELWRDTSIVRLSGRLANVVSKRF